MEQQHNIILALKKPVYLFWKLKFTLQIQVLRWLYNILATAMLFITKETFLRIHITPYNLMRLTLAH